MAAAFQIYPLQFLLIIYKLKVCGFKSISALNRSVFKTLVKPALPLLRRSMCKAFRNHIAILGANKKHFLIFFGLTFGVQIGKNRSNHSIIRKSIII